MQNDLRAVLIGPHEQPEPFISDGPPVVFVEHPRRQALILSLCRLYERLDRAGRAIEAGLVVESELRWVEEVLQHAPEG